MNFQSTLPCRIFIRPHQTVWKIIFLSMMLFGLGSQFGQAVFLCNSDFFMFLIVHQSCRKEQNATSHRHRHCCFHDSSQHFPPSRLNSQHSENGPPACATPLLQFIGNGWQPFFAALHWQGVQVRSTQLQADTSGHLTWRR